MMTEAKNSISTHQTTLTADEIQKIRKLMQFIDFEPSNNSLIFYNKQGNARILLRDDGTVLVEGENISVTANTDMRFSAAKIDMN